MIMESPTYNVLIVTPEATEPDLSLQVLLVDSSLPNLSTYSSSSEQTTRALLELGNLDAVVVRLPPGSRDLEMVYRIQEIAPDVSLVVAAGTRDRSLAPEVLAAGVQDCIFEDELSTGVLQRSVKYAVEHRRAELTLERLRRYDPATGLLNQTAFLGLLERWCDRARRGGAAAFALLLLKVEELEACSQTFDRQREEQALRIAARRVRQTARPGDLLALLDGGELALLLPAVARRHQAHVAGRRIARMLSRPLEIGQQHLEPTVRWSYSLFDRSRRGAREMLEGTAIDLRSPVPAVAGF